MVTLNKNITTTPIEEFAKLANDAQIERTSKALEASGWLGGDEMNIGIDLKIVKQTETKFEELEEVASTRVP
jgi:hypothetical protein